MHALRRSVLRAVSSNPSTLLSKPCQSALLARRVVLQHNVTLRTFGSTIARCGEIDNLNLDSATPNTTPEARQQESRSSVGEAAGTNPYIRNPPNERLYVGNLSFEVTEDMLRQQFESMGPISDVKIVRDIRGLSKGFGFVTFQTVETATRAMQTMDLVGFLGRRMSVHFASERRLKQKRESTPSATLYIGNISYEMTDQDFHNLFRQVRDCTAVRVAVDRQSSKPRGFCHADFIDIEAATKAKAFLCEQTFYGRHLIADFAGSRVDRFKEQMRSSIDAEAQAAIEEGERRTSEQPAEKSEDEAQSTQASSA